MSVARGQVLVGVKEHDNRDKILLMWANWMGMEEVTEDTKLFYSTYSYKELVRPFVVMDRNIDCEKYTWQMLANKYRLTYQEIRTIYDKGACS